MDKPDFSLATKRVEAHVNQRGDAQLANQTKWGGLFKKSGDSRKKISGPNSALESVSTPKPGRPRGR